MNLSRDEMETIINYNEADRCAVVYTCNKSLRRKLDRLSEERPKECSIICGNPEGKAGDYKVPKSWIKVSPPPARREMTEDQKQRLRERLAAARKMKSTPES